MVSSPPIRSPTSWGAGSPPPVIELHLVGGPVRDALLGRLEDDLDFTTDARPEQVLALVDGWADGTWDTGIAFGTVGVAKSGLRLEITTFRSDLYDGETRNPVVTFGDTLAGDLQRRDFAVNAMAVSLPGHEFTDPFGGLASWPPGCWTPRARRSSRSATIRCGCCGRPGSPPSCRSPRPRGWSRR